MSTKVEYQAEIFWLVPSHNNPKVQQAQAVDNKMT
jgi:hypothetical protein